MARFADYTGTEDDFSGWGAISTPAGGTWGSLGGNYANIQPTTNMSSTGSFNTGTDWSRLFVSTLQLLPNIFSAAQGRPYGTNPSGQQSAPQGYAPGGGGQGIYAGGSFLGASGFGNISGTTLLLIAAVAFFALRGRR